MTTNQLLLVDLSSLAHPLFHISSNEPDPNWTATQIVARVRALASSHPHAALCCDSGRSFRNDMAPRVALGEGKYDGYKANRPEKDARLQHQIDTAVATLRRDGFPVWSAQGFEADDVIASATAQALAIDGAEVLIATADKDLLQLVSDRVTVKNVAPSSKGEIRDVAGVVEKFGVRPEQMLDWLCLVGDTSDNVKGADGIGAIKATQLLKAHGTLQAIYEKMQQGVVPGITPALRTSLVDFAPRWPLVKSLIQLRTDVPVPLHEIAEERTVAAMDEDAVSEAIETMREVDAELQESGVVSDAPLGRELTAAQATDALGAATAKATERIAPKATDIAVSQPPVDFSQQLEPRTMTEAIQLAQRMYDSRLFSAYGTPQAVLATVLAGRELGIPAMASLRGMHIIEGKPQLSADTLAALVLRSGKAKYFRCVERTPERATFVTQRLPMDDYPEQRLTITIEEMRKAWPKDEAAWNKSGWGRNPADLLVARCKSKLARLEYADVVGNLYSFEEFDGDRG